MQRNADSEWGTGRAGMQYRDLIPGRLGGRLIASHIRITKGGPVPDYVHHHDIEFQVIYCFRGWVKVVYEDQGEPFVMRTGDCVLQPPHIRHRVLECSDGMEVIEISSPAEHETHVDHEMRLPTPTTNVDREFGGQRFVHHRLNEAGWFPDSCDGFEARDTGVADATCGLVSVQVIRPFGPTHSAVIRCDAGIVFLVVLEGEVTLHRERHAQQILVAGDSFAVTSGMQAKITNNAGDLELLRVSSS